MTCAPSLPVRSLKSCTGSYHLRSRILCSAGPRLCTSSRGLRGLQSVHLRALPTRLREVFPPRRRGDTKKGRHGAFERARIVAERE